jgi:Na+-driven multidrug efflux pump
MLGGTHSKNSNTFDILDLSLIKPIEFNGVDVHANAIMTIFYLDGKLKRLDFFSNILIILFVFMVVDFIVYTLFLVFRVKNKIISFIGMSVVNLLILFFISIYLLEVHKVWFNWFVPVIPIQLAKVIVIFTSKDNKRPIFERLKKAF